MAGIDGTILKTTNGGVGISENARLSESTFSLYPNPTNGKITISNNENSQKENIVSIFNIQGELVISNYFQNSIEIDCSKLSKGIFMVKLQTDKGIITKKLVIN